jgi:translin
MDNLEDIAERIHQSFDARTAARDRTLAQTRTLTRHCANAIRAVHRGERLLALEHLAQARELADGLRTNLAGYPDLYYAGYTQDSLKEWAEASIVFALIEDEPLPTPEELSLEHATYLQGLAEAAGELRRRCLDILRSGHSQEAEKLLSYMDDIYAVLVTMDYPDAITGGLRRLTDIVRGINERTRGDMTISLRQGHLEQSLLQLQEQLDTLSPQSIAQDLEESAENPSIAEE